ncbi:hypothetical protein [Mycoplasma sp. Mirounga ES2805-ORL]|uniref:hypothetical protein n=1 Tax=Mycoplasma sp. Mirounga ES2805-ORL TaxID=754514 RepID=UPI00197B9E20|nr:hypothetical protein [Mycoplasma sp. Mirounga ES2805-ORL]QSF13692.1 hypothetical protein JXZ90_00090 [Mycoplasma sp. Mirounga ES2805-ORL]
MNKKGDIAFGKIIELNVQRLRVVTRSNYIFEIPKKYILDWSPSKILSEFKVGEKINFIIESVDKKNKTGIGNFKKLHALYERSPFQREIKETKHGFKNLIDDLGTYVDLDDKK